MKKAVIFGHTGQDGHYLTELLKKENIDVYGISRSFMDYKCDITNFNSVQSMLEDINPDYIFNFAAISTTSHNVLFENNTIIGPGTCNLLEAVRLVCPKARVFLSGSGLQFVNNGEPINENSAVTAESPYAAVRNYTYYLAQYYRNTYDLKVYFGFFFTHDSPLRTSSHMSQKIAIAARKAAKNEKVILEIGDMDVEKEYMFAGDAVNAVWILVNQDSVYEVVIGSGEVFSIKDWVKTCFDIAGLDWTKYIRTKDGFKSEYRRLISNPERIRRLGWQPKVSFHALAKMMMEDL